MRPKMGKVDIDYQKLHDAFFRWQTKPKMTIHGDLYYEGKEFETRLKEKKPGDLSDDLKQALGMPIEKVRRHDAHMARGRERWWMVVDECMGVSVSET